MKQSLVLFNFLLVASWFWKHNFQNLPDYRAFPQDSFHCAQGSTYTEAAADMVQVCPTTAQAGDRIWHHYNAGFLGLQNETGLYFKGNLGNVWQGWSPCTEFLSGWHMKLWGWSQNSTGDPKKLDARSDEYLPRKAMGSKQSQF
jgi:hypothetical protein